MAAASAAATTDFIAACRQSLGQFADELQDALVYLDEGAGEAFHFMGGLPFFLQFGVRSVCSLENARPYDSANTWNAASDGPLQKMIIITSRLLSDSHRYILRCLRMHCNVQLLTIFSSVSEDAHATFPGTPLGTDAYAEYKNLLLQDFDTVSGTDPAHDQIVHDPKGEENIALAEVIQSQPEVNPQEHKESPLWAPESNEDRDSRAASEKKKSPTIQVYYIPLILCPLTPKIFVLPSGAAIAEAPLLDSPDYSLGPGLPGIDIGVPIDGEEHIPPGAILLAFFLQHLGSQLDLKFEVFTLGRLARAVGKFMIELPNLPEGGGHTKRPAGLVIIDRSLDLITPSCHGDSLVDQMFFCLPRRTRKDAPIHPVPVGAAANFISTPVVHAPVDVRVPSEQFIFLEEKGQVSISLEDPLCPLSPKVEQDRRESRQEMPEDSKCSKSFSNLQAANFSGNMNNLLGGSLSCAWEFNAFDRLDLLFGKGAKDGAMLIRKWLQDAVRQEKLDLPRKTRLGAVTVSELQSLVKALSAVPKAAIRNMTLIQIARAAIMTLHASCSLRWEAFRSVESILMLSARDCIENLALQIRDLINHSIQHTSSKSHQQHATLAPSQKASLLSLRDSLTVAIVAYALAGKCDLRLTSADSPFTWDEEYSLKEAVLNVILGSPQGISLGFLKGLEDALEERWKKAELESSLKADSSPVKHNERSDDWTDDQWEGWDEAEEEGSEAEEFGDMQLKLEVRDRLEEVFKILHRVAAARNRLALSEKLQSPDDLSSSLGLHKGLIYKLMSLIARKADVSGLEHHSSTVGRIFKSGLGRFGLGQVKPKVGDQKVLLLFVIGGFNAVEVREAREALASAPGGIELLFGGTTLLTPDHMYDLMLGSCRSS
ncbi:hypothetical protein O6H91_07G038400 [Diphasiastrum complanatum]|uniref:Uncharacterized protein n=5 Tax=Diphasiastrum complanatum TaxID=34168 RepID=A0ACC2D444_DIPCM|nr:hypothetical protein O6H91_07G038400 [Diphasiastrum complanatum]KAJ7549058.1 hypothetical protein O6H91_07G038400 [Diphasiastrum complanatum]KAJ7549059.1 hypothetical protein O6H91_07G038400 [Diphasiastrum complanatum]KAJ7549060.1 hypothetical protein O6H91_07G038400 [Diphasiastrum complanatum]KAJ7549061.1 hypothetical protein O6H91_07G038400 [Diphasiastrum complanatum]